jgi:PEP-CTERM motif-containing protein
LHTLTGADLHHWYIFELNPQITQPFQANVLLGSPLSATSAVPEPATWAMMLLGFAGLGFAFRQSRRKVSFA